MFVKSPTYMSKNKTSQFYTLRGSSTDFKENIPTDFWAEKIYTVSADSKKDGGSTTDRLTDMVIIITNYTAQI